MRLSGQTSIFGGVFFVFKSLLGIERQKKLKKISFLTWKPQSHVRILIYRTWPNTESCLCASRFCRQVFKMSDGLNSDENIVNIALVAFCSLAVTKLAHWPMSSFMYQSNRSFNISPPGKPRVFEFLENFFFKFPPPVAEKLFKCPIIGPFQVIIMPPLPGNFSVAFIMLRKLCM